AGRVGPRGDPRERRVEVPARVPAEQAGARGRVELQQRRLGRVDGAIELVAERTVQETIATVHDLEHRALMLETRTEVERSRALAPARACPCAPTHVCARA